MKLRHLTLLLPVAIFMTSCVDKTGESKGTPNAKDAASLSNTDSLKDQRPNWDKQQNEYYHSIEKQISLTNLESNVDSIELRLWIDRAFSPMTSLYSLKLQDTSAILMYSEIYLRQFNWEKDDQHKWNPMTTPIVDSVKAISVSLRSTLDKHILSGIKIDSMFLLPSQRDIKGDFGATDGESMFFVIADKNRYRFLYYNNPVSSYTHTKEINHKYFLKYVGVLETLASYEKMYDRIDR